MGIAQNIKQKLVNWLLESKSAGHTAHSGNFAISFITDGLSGWLASFGIYNESELIKAFHTIGEVYGPINQIASRVAQAKWILKKTKDNSIVSDNKYFNRLFTQPNPFQTFQDFIYEMQVYELATGNNFLYANCPFDKPDYTNISTLINLSSDQVAIRTKPIVRLLSATEVGDIILCYNVTNGTGITEIQPKYILHSKYLSLFCTDYRLRGVSPLASAQYALDNLKLVYAARNKVYKTGGALGILTSQHSDATGNIPLTPTEKKELQDDYYHRHGLTKKDQVPVAITAANVKYIKIGANIQELMPFEETEADANLIQSVLKVPKELGPTEKMATYANKNEAEKGLYNNTVIPIAQGIALRLTDFLGFRAEGYHIEVAFDHVPVLQENAKEKAEVGWRNNETCRVQFAHGLITLNDWRRTCKMIPVKNALYDKLLLEMTDEELLKVMSVLKMAKSNAVTLTSENNPEPTPNKN